MNKPMDDKNLTQAACALSMWFESQSIDPADAAAVCGTYIAACIRSIAENDEDMKEGMRAFVADLYEDCDRYLDARD